ncbi:transcriptional regulator, TetR family [Ruminococcaceae bacterium YRB3002]|nr:transcriptional regulator, TetR family [Ruminococcaceae bacterium YRB3002]
MNTKQRILDEALTLFSERGYANVYVGDIADRVGIKAPSLYKHYKSKQAIFEAILDEMSAKFLEQAAALNISGNNAATDVGIYENMNEDSLVKLGKDLFLFFLHDDYNRRFRKMLTIEQFHDGGLAEIYSQQYVEGPLAYQGMMFAMMSAHGFLIPEDPEIMTLHFYAPIYMLLTVCDRQPSKEQESLIILEKHIRQFDRLYGRKDI